MKLQASEASNLESLQYPTDQFAENRLSLNALDRFSQTTTYAIGFELYDNGISRALTLDYNDFVVAGKLTSLEIKEPKPCP